MTILNYVNLHNIEKEIDAIRSAYAMSSPIAFTTLNKANLKGFLTPSLSGQLMVYTFSEEFIGSLIIKATSYSFGKITDNTLFTIELYNNSYNDMTIENINIANLSGLSLQVESLIIKPQQSNIVYATIATEGESNNAGYIEFVVDGQSYFVTVEYEREAIFSYFIDRGEDVVLNYQYNTQIKKSFSGKEVREGRNENPRLTVDYVYKEDGHDRRKMENTIITDNYATLFLPLWTEKFNATNVGTKVYGDFKHTSIDVGSFIYAWELDKSQILTVLGVGDGFLEVEKISSGFDKFYVYPLIVTRIADTVVESKITKDGASFLISFEADEEKTHNLLNTHYNFNYPMLDGLPFYNFLRDNQGSTQRTFTKSVVVLDNEISKRSRFVKNKISETATNFNILMFGKKEVSEMKDIFNRSVGSLRSFYVLKDDFDFEILENLEQGSKIITIRDVNSLTLFNNGVFQYIYILYNQVEPMILKVEEVRKGANGTEVLIVDNIIHSVNLNKIRFSSYVSKSRFNNDGLSISYKSNDVVTVGISIKNINNKE